MNPVEPKYQTKESQIDFLVANLIEFYRPLKNESKWFNAAKIALNQVARVSSCPVAKLQRRFAFFASRLKNNISAKSIRYFANECIDLAYSLGVLQEEKKIGKQTRNLSATLEKNINKALTSGDSPEVALKKAAFGLYLESKAHEKSTRQNNLLKSHPLRETLQTLQTKESKLSREDIRNHFLFLRRSPSKDNPAAGTLFNLLKKAQLFSAPRIHRLLGDNLFLLCRPVGFVDKLGQTLEVHVPSNSHLYALTYKKQEIIRALKKDLNFTNLKNIKFKVLTED